MKKNKNTTKNSNHTKIDWSKFDSISESQLEAAIDSADDIADIDWSRAQVGIPQRKKAIHIMLDSDLLDWLKKGGKGYQTRINSILRAYMKSISVN